MTFGEKLYTLRKRNGISQEQLANSLNVSRQAISKWETGAIPDVSNILKIASYFDCSLDYLLNDQYEEDLLRKESSVSQSELPIPDVSAQQSSNWIRITFRILAAFSLSGICILLILSRIFPPPLFRQDPKSGNWMVGISAFIEYHHLHSLTNVLFILLSVSILVIVLPTVFRLWPQRQENNAKKQLYFLFTSVFLALSGIAFLYYRFFFMYILMWNWGVTCLFFFYILILSASILLYQHYKTKTQHEKEENTSRRN